MTERTALVVMVSRRGNPPLKRALWRVSIPDAQRICSDERTAGRNFMLVWYGQENLPDHMYGETWEFVPDDGRFNGLLAELGVRTLEDLTTRQYRAGLEAGQ